MDKKPTLEVMDKAQALEIANKYANAVLKEFDPLQIMLFGSYNNGTPHKWSDIDVAVIYDKYTGPGDLWDGVTRLTSLTLQTDTTDVEPHLMQLSDDPWGFAHSVLKTGLALYIRGQGDRGQGTENGKIKNGFDVGFDVL